MTRRQLTEAVNDDKAAFDDDPYRRASAMNARLEADDPMQANRVHFVVKDGVIDLEARPEYQRAVKTPRNRLGRTYSQAEVDRIVQQKGRLLSMAMDMGAIVQRSDGTYRPA